MVRKALLALALSWLAMSAAPARAATFVAPGGDWRTLETAHFRIHFRSELREIARKVAEFAEEAHARLGPYFGRPDDVTHVTILDTQDSTNGFGTPFPEASLTFFLTPPSPDEEWYVGRYDNWLKMILAHEYVHVLQARSSAGPGAVPGYLNAAAVRAFLPEFAPLLSLDFLPEFLKEGLAVYQESAISGGGRALEGYFDMVLRSQYLSGKVLGIDQASGKYDLDWAPGGGRYLYGTAFYTYLSRKYGEQAAPTLTARLGEAPWLGINLAASRALGKSAYELWDEAIAFYRERYERQIKAISSRPVTRARAVTASGRNHRHPRWLDAKTLLYTRSPLEGTAGLFKSGITGDDPEATAVLVLAKSSRKSYTLSADRRFLYYYAEGESPRLASFSDIHRFDLARGVSEPFTRGARASFPAVSPDGERILAVLGGEARKDLGMFDRKGKLLWRLRGPDFGSFASPAWSPDGKRVALVQWIDGRTNVVLFDPETRTLQAVAPEDAVQLYPAWSPDGTTLLFASDRTGVFNLHAVRLADRKRYRLTNVLGGAFDPDVSPDGKNLAFVEYGPAGYDVKVMPYDPAAWLPEDPDMPLEARGHYLGGDLVALATRAPGAEGLASGSREGPAAVTRARDIAAQGAESQKAGAGEGLAAVAGARNIQVQGGEGLKVGAIEGLAALGDGEHPAQAAAAWPDRVPEKRPFRLPPEELEAVRRSPERPYNPLETLLPQLVWPYAVLDTSQVQGLALALPGNLAMDLGGAGPWLSIRAYGQDVLRQHTYVGLAGVMLGTSRPMAALSYWNDLFDPTIGVGFSLLPDRFLKGSEGGVLQRDEQAFFLSLTYPPPESVLLKSWLTGTVGTVTLRSRAYSVNRQPVLEIASNAGPLRFAPAHLPISQLGPVPMDTGEVALGVLALPNQVNSLSFTLSGNSAERPYLRPFTPSSGALWTVGVERADRAIGSEIDLTRAWADLRYFLPTWGRHVLALRAVGGAGFATPFVNRNPQSGLAEVLLNPRAFSLGERLAAVGDASIGRAAGAAIHDFDDLRGLPGEVGDTLPLRGYPVGAPVPGRTGQSNADYAGFGDHGALLTAEYRIPLLEVQRGLGTVPIFFDRLSIAPFVEVGKAWTVFDQALPLWSAGVELRTHVTLAQYIPTQVRLGYARGLTANLGVNQVILGIGSAF